MQLVIVGVVVVCNADGRHFAQAVTRQKMIDRHFFTKHFNLRISSRRAADNRATQGGKFISVEIFIVDEGD